jgi:hypothetical protein
MCWSPFLSVEILRELILAVCEAIRNTSGFLDTYESQSDDTLRPESVLKVDTLNSSYETQASEAWTFSVMLICVWHM